MELTSEPKDEEAQGKGQLHRTRLRPYPLPVLLPPRLRAAEFLLDLLESHKGAWVAKGEFGVAHLLQEWSLHVAHFREPSPGYWPHRTPDAQDQVAELLEELAGAVEAQADYVAALTPLYAQALRPWADWLRAGPAAGRFCPLRQPPTWTDNAREWLQGAIVWVSLFISGGVASIGGVFAYETIVSDPRLSWVNPLSLVCPLLLGFVAGWTLLSAALHRLFGMRLSD